MKEFKYEDGDGDLLSIKPSVYEGGYALFMITNNHNKAVSMVLIDSEARKQLAAFLLSDAFSQ